MWQTLCCFQRNSVLGREDWDLNERHLLRRVKDGGMFFQADRDNKKSRCSQLWIQWIKSIINPGSVPLSVFVSWPNYHRVRVWRVIAVEVPTVQRGLVCHGFWRPRPLKRQQFLLLIKNQRQFGKWNSLVKEEKLEVGDKLRIEDSWLRLEYYKIFHLARI